MITPAYSPTATERVLPRLALDFTTAVLDGRVTVTRALDTATRINSSGFVEVVNANLPRFDYTLNTGGACKGLLIEESRTNILRNWSDFTAVANWTAVGVSGGSAPTNTGNTTTAPDGVSSAQIWTFTAPVSGDRSVLSQTVSGLATGDWASSAFMKAGRPADVGKIVAIKETQGGTYTLVTLTDQWQRPTSINNSAATTHGMAFELRPAVGTSAGTVQVALWGAQTEAGAFITSAIPNTSTASVTRNADVVSMTGTNFSSWYNASEGTFTVQFDSAAVSASGAAVYYALGASDGTTSNINGVYLFQTTSYGASVVGGATQANITAGTVTVNTTQKITYAYKANSFSAALNGAAANIDTSGSIPTVDRLTVGASYSGSNLINGHVAKLAFYPQRLTNNEVRAFSK